MKNSIKIMAALKQMFPGHVVEYQYKQAHNVYSIFLDRCEHIATFDSYFFEADFDNPEIEIKIKAPLKNIEWFVKDASSFGIIRGAVERGLEEWREGSQQNN